MVASFKPNQIKSLLLWLALFSYAIVSAQFYNKEVKASLIIEKTSEFYTFKASAENLTPSDYNLRYDFMIFKQDENDNVVKSNQEERFFLKANEKRIVSSLTVNFNVEGQIIVVLVIYDKDDKPIGQDRIEMKEGGKTQLEITPIERQAPVSQDQARPQDGYFIQGQILENTITKAGRDFYRYFYLDFYNRNISTSKNIVIDEVPGRSRNTRISVKVDNRLVWQFFAQPKKEFLKEMAATAMGRSISYLQQLQRQKEQLTRY